MQRNVNNNQAKLVIGLGPGKSATKTQAHFLNAQPGIVGIHEGRFGLLSATGLIPDIVSWYDDYAGVERHIKKLYQCATMRESFGHGPIEIVAEIAMYFLPYVRAIITDYPAIKFICIKRDPERVIESWLGVTKNNVRHWSVGGTTGFFPPLTKIIGRRWDKCFPKYDLSHREACRKYVLDYYQEVDALKREFPNTIGIFRIDDLKSPEGRSAILDFIGYHGPRVTDTEIWEHKERELLKFLSGRI